MEALRKTITTVNRGAATGKLSYRLAGFIGKRAWRHVIEYEGDAILDSLVDYAVLFLIVYLVRLPDFELVRSAIDREPDFWIRRNGHVDTVRTMK